MKHTIIALGIFSLTFNTGCIKSLLDKDEKKNQQSDSYAGVWRLTGGAADQDGDRVLDANERTQINATSELNLKEDFTYTYMLSVNGNTQNMSGNWTLSPDKKSLTISDNSGRMRFDIQSPKEIHTEPIPANGSSVWLIYTR